MKKNIIASFILGALILNGSITSADVLKNTEITPLKDKEGNPLKENKEYYLHFIDNGTTGYYPCYYTSVDNWQYGYTNWRDNQPIKKNIVKLKTLNLFPDPNNTNDSIYSHENFSIEAPYSLDTHNQEKLYGLDTNTHRYWKIHGLDSLVTNTYLYLAESNYKSWFRLNRFENETYHNNHYNLEVAADDTKYLPIGRQSSSGGVPIVGYGMNNIQAFNNSDLKTKVEFIPVK